MMSYVVRHAGALGSYMEELRGWFGLDFNSLFDYQGY